MTECCEIGLLGPVEAWCQGRQLRIPAGKARTLLAALLLRPRRVVTAAHLAEYLDDSPDAPGWSSRLHTCVNRLRKALADCPTGAVLIQTTPGGYLADLSPDSVDLGRFHAMARGAELRRAEGDLTGAVELLRGALALWRGPALVDVDSTVLRREVADTLDEERLRAVELRIDLELALGRHAGLVGELQTMVRRYPLREELWRYLMTALLHGGRQAEALEAYRTIRTLLAENIGVEPGQALRDTHQAVLRGAGSPPQATPAQCGDDRAWEPPWVTVSSLPPEVVDFVGRSHVVRDVVGWLTEDTAGASSPAVVVIHGLSGMGKSALAARLAHALRPRFPDGQHWIRMRHGTDAAAQAHDLMGDLLHLSGVAAGRVPATPVARESLYRNRLKGKRVLVVLDDATDSAQVNQLLPASGDCAFIITGYHALRSIGGRVRHVGLAEFALSEGVALLERIIGRSRIAEEPDAAQEIVARCGGHPLALRVFGSRLAALPHRRLTAVLPLLRNTKARLDQLATTDHQVRSSLALGYSSMPAALRRTFRRLSVFGDRPFASWAAGLLGEDSDGDRVVEQLLDHGMLVPAGTDDTGEPRYHLHTLLSVYGEELREEDPATEQHAALRLVLDGYTLLSERAMADMVVLTTDDIPSPPWRHPVAIPEELVERVGSDAEAWFRAERENLLDLSRQAAAAGCFAEAQLLLIRVSSTEYANGNWERLAQAHAAIRDLARRAGDREAALRAEAHRITTATVGGDMVSCATAFEACVEELATTSLHALRARCLAALSFCYQEQGRSQDAFAASKLSVDLAEEAGDPRVLAFCLRLFATRVGKLGDLPRSLALFDRALEVIARCSFNEVSGIVSEGRLRRGLGQLLLDAGDLVRARHEAGLAAELLGRCDGQYGGSYADLLLSRINFAEGRLTEAVDWAVRARKTSALLGDRRGLAATGFHLGQALAAQGEHQRALDELRAALPTMLELNLNPRSPKNPFRTLTGIVERSFSRYEYETGDL
ncbi:NB-ARC domain-containing protein [Allokutzneria sp. A3M-2-11 16]|uniref:AfsR/SARP family transcriptional regulator n=1 Tax=Allokutzneria sp. A3M-2-11 16 TaxID=2962043 RepID=UPI0020B7DD0F|nr:BTAD domain-containing putative transcriptional regulator [Allokutzneria sp. A3M-2-11 16]MCP3805067.1 NB-ARC domain-containing protein [Allokutzneria sp. A3M-2-11 16]